MIIEYTTLAVYLGVLLTLGALFARFNKNLSDFARGGGRGTWWLVGSSILMSAISAFTFTGNASAAYEGGPSLLVIYLANCCGFAVGGLFLGPWLRQTRAFTTADVIRGRFGTPVEQLFAYTGLFLGPITAAIQLYALSLFVSTILGLPLVPLLVTIGLIVTFYSTTGGKWAVMATDLVQATVMIAVTVLVCFLSLRAVGGLGEFFRHFSDPSLAEDFRFINEPGAFPGDRFTWKWAIVVFFMQVNTQISLSAAGRYIAARDGREASRAAWFGLILMMIGSVIWFIPPMVTRFLYESELLASVGANPSESAYAFIAMKLLPNGLVGLLIAAMFAATMSSMDTGLNNQVGILVRNVIPRLRYALGHGEDLSPKTEIRICHLATLCLGVLIIFMGILFILQDKVALFDAFLTIGSVVGIPMGFPLLVGLWVRRLPKWAYFPIFLACLLPSLWSFLDSSLNGNTWTVQDRTLWIFVFGIGASTICRLWVTLTGNRQSEDIREFYECMHNPIDFDRELGRSSVDYEQYFVLAKAVVFTGLLVLLLLFVPNPLFDRLCILGISGFILSIGVLLAYGGRRVRHSHCETSTDGSEDV